jgi:bifunctional N-acetylglucosamine-1-phosphate-uridyltransferase/glucosamine-1-phosphate-acetyltransferase GlmU-like protein
MHNNNNNNNNGLSELLIDNVQSYGEILPNQNDEIIMIEEDLDDDEDEAYEKSFFLLI